MNSLDTNCRTPLRYNHRSPLINFLNKNKQPLLSKSSSGLGANSMSHGYQSRILRESNSFDIFPVVKTPPAKRFSKVVNPFEAALTDRLHLPLIESPTLFQRPSTPQHSSTQFAWTIDDVSSLQPANVEPYETQFHDSPDPELEAKAQSAISLYFKEQQIAPSPIDCAVRGQRVVLSATNTPVCKPGRRIRNNAAQTILSLPPILPDDLEIALAPYFIFNECQQDRSSLPDSSFSVNEYDLRDASLRRKLFDNQGVAYINDETFGETDSFLLTVSSPPPQSPELTISKTIRDEIFFNSRLSDQMDKSSFGCISPIAQSLSLDNDEIGSHSTNYKPASPPLIPLYDNYRLPRTEGYASPHYEKSPKNRFSTPEQSLTRLSSDSVRNIQISELLVDTAKRSRASVDFDLFEDESQDIEEDEMQVSQLSAISNISSESETPRSKRRSANRKNLSQSFSNQCRSNNNENGNNCEQIGFNNDTMGLIPNQLSRTTYMKVEKNLTESSILHRTDSGFNDMSASTSQIIEKHNYKMTLKEDTAKLRSVNCCDANVSMICCSTPTKHFAVS